ncbi:nucleoside triphosphate pyrophosphohydrolase, partial [Pseudomonas aeruginosa]
MYRLADLLQLHARQRHPEFGCPWDLPQSSANHVPHPLA